MIPVTSPTPLALDETPSNEEGERGREEHGGASDGVPTHGHLAAHAKDRAEHTGPAHRVAEHLWDSAAIGHVGQFSGDCLLRHAGEP